MEEKNTPKGPLIAIIVIVLALAGLAVYALGNQQDVAQPNDTTPTANDTSPAPDEAAPAPSERMLITYKDEGFEPRNITVKKGTSITVKNESSRDAQFSSSEHPTHRDNPEMNLKTLAPGESDSYVATDVGSWTYHDHLSPDKTGTVTVTE